MGFPCSNLYLLGIHFSSNVTMNMTDKESGQNIQFLR